MVLHCKKTLTKLHKKTSYFSFNHNHFSDKFSQFLACFVKPSKKRFLCSTREGRLWEELYKNPNARRYQLSHATQNFEQKIFGFTGFIFFGRKMTALYENGHVFECIRANVERVFVSSCKSRQNCRLCTSLWNFVNSFRSPQAIDLFLFLLSYDSIIFQATLVYIIPHFVLKILQWPFSVGVCGTNLLLVTKTIKIQIFSRMFIRPKKDIASPETFRLDF